MNQGKGSTLWLIRLSNDDDTVFHWGLENGYDGRTILRAAFLLTRGNVLFGSWGMCSTDTYEVELALHKTLTVHSYVSGGVLDRRYPGKSHGSAFNLFIDHYIPPISQLSVPSEQVIEKVRAGALGTLFTPKQLRTAYYNANYQLFFHSDYYVLYYYRWHSFRDFQITVVRNYVRLRGWTVDSTWLELIIDVAWFGCFWTAFVYLSFQVQGYAGLILDPFWTAARYPLWITVWENFMIRRTSDPIPLDRFSLWRLAIVFGRWVFQFCVLDVLALSIVEIYWPIDSHSLWRLVALWLGVALCDAFVFTLTQDMARAKRDFLSISLCGVMLGLVSLLDLNVTRSFASTGSLVAVYVFGMTAFIWITQESTTRFVIDRGLFRRFAVLPLLTCVIIHGCLLAWSQFNQLNV